MKHVVVSSAGETAIFFRHLSSESHCDLNARSRETERSDRARSNRDAINERRFRWIGLIRLNKRTDGSSGDQINLINLHDFSNAASV